MRTVAFSSTSLLIAIPLLIACGAGNANTAQPSPAESRSSTAPVARNDPSVPAESTAAATDPAVVSEPGKASKSHTAETRTPSVIAQTFKAHRDAPRGCFDEALKKHPGMRGNLTISFVIDRHGRVQQASVNTARSTLNDAELCACVIDAVLQIPFPASSRGRESMGNYPFNFNP